MAQKREKISTHTIRVFPWRAGLMTAGQQTTIPENALWQAKNVTAALDGLLSKRPGTSQWGQTIQKPDPDATNSTVTSFTDFLGGIAGFVEADSSSGLITTGTASAGILKTSVASGSSNENYELAHSVPAASAKTAWSLRFIFSGTNLPAYSSWAGAGNDANTFAVRGQSAANTGKEFAIWAEGIYYLKNSDSTYQLISGTAKAATGAWTVIEIQVDDGASGVTNVYIDDVLATTTAITSADIKDISLTNSTTDFEFWWEVEGSGGTGKQYNTQIVTPMYNDTISTPFTATTIDAVKDFQYITNSSSPKSALLCASGEYVYADNGLLGVWRPLKLRHHSEIFFFDYRRTIIWTDNDGAQQAKVWQWNGYEDPEKLDVAPAIRFGDEHQQRIIAAGDRRNPLRVYLCADRQSNVWYSPSPENIEDQFDVALDAGYIEIPSGKGDEVTNVRGDHFGVAIIWTRRGAWRLLGHGPTSYRIERIAGIDVGCESYHGSAQIGNDIWFIGRQGIQSLATTEKYGDLQIQFPGAPIQNLWGQDPSSVVRISTQYLYKAKMDYNPQQGLLYVAVPLTGNTETDNVFVYNTGTGVWLGPWDISSRAMSNIEIGMPRLEVMAHGGTDGKVIYTNQSRTSDVGDAAIDMVLESAYLNGRSIDPLLVGLNKRWHRLRIFLLPRGDWDFDIEWQVDSQKKKGPVSKNQIGTSRDRPHTLGNDWKIGDNPGGRLRSREEMRYVEQILDIHGYNMSFKLTDDTAGQDLVPQGFEVEFSLGGYEVT
jgi:hypothetical protein